MFGHKHMLCAASCLGVIQRCPERVCFHPGLCRPLLVHGSLACSAGRRQDCMQGGACCPFGCQFDLPVGTISPRAGWFAGGWYGVRGSVGGWEESLKWLLQPLSEAGTFLVFPHPMINSASCACRADVSKAIVPCKPCTTQLLGL